MTGATLSAEVLKQIRMIQLRAGYLVTEALAGNYLSAFKGRGMEFDEVREYVPGDDVRSIDWNVTARMGGPYVKVLREERELTIMLLIDVSPSLGFGSTSKTKSELAAELAAVLAFLAIRNNDKVGLLAFSDHVEAFIPPQKGRSHVWNIIRTVLTHKGSGKTTDIGMALDALRRYVPRRCLSFLVSDFWTGGFEKALLLATSRHDLTAVRIVDRREAELVAAGLVTFTDSETGELVVVDTSDRRVREDYRRAALEREAELTALLRRHGVKSFTVGGTAKPQAQLATGAAAASGTTASHAAGAEETVDVTGPLLRYLRERERRRG